MASSEESTAAVPPVGSEAGLLNGDPPPDGTLRFVALGGLGEIGKNMAILEVGGDAVVIDAGLMFPDQEMLGVDLVIPDITALRQRAGRLRGILLTHGHEDHIGALPYLLPELDCPVFGTPMTLGLLRNKLRRNNAAVPSERLRPVAVGEEIRLGAIRAEFVHTTHSVPDSCALVLDTPAGRVLHTGDFKLDHTPVSGPPPDLARLAEVGRLGVRLMLSDSTNAEVAGVAPSESAVGPALRRVMETAEGRVLVVTFASNIARVQQAIDLAVSSDRRCCIVGRNMLSNVDTAVALGRLTVAPGTVIGPRQLAGLADRAVCLIATGAQGEPLSALARISAGTHPFVQVRPTDTVVVSANPIPANEEVVHRVLNRLARLGARVLIGGRDGVHASGHAGADELRFMLELIHPESFVPVHGEHRHLIRHADLATDAGLPRAAIVVADNGTVIDVDAAGIREVGRVPAGNVYVDGVSVEDVVPVVLRDRRALSQDGILIVALAVGRERGELIGGPEIVSRGFAQDARLRPLLGRARAVAREACTGGPAGSRDPVELREAMHDALAAFFLEATGRRPMILPVISEV